mmetsp:Transcript_17379/g.20725  ORF Transcript_17379/g.20725 Transcript_17379/m.20725 type:complete len:81 (-) Transcript_17379:79-321(-)
MPELGSYKSDDIRRGTKKWIRVKSSIKRGAVLAVRHICRPTKFVRAKHRRDDDTDQKKTLQLYRKFAIAFAYIERDKDGA